MRTTLVLLCALAVLPSPATAQTKPPDPPIQQRPLGEQLAAMRFRAVGPFRGGRVTAVTGVRGEPFVFYQGATGGGVWKTEDGGDTWRPVSDQSFKTGSVGAVAVAESDP